MKKIIILLLCCRVLVNMLECGGNNAPPPMESPPTKAAETIVTETPVETTPPITAVEPTEKEKEHPPTESTAQATEPTVTATEPTTTEKPKEETKPTATEKQTEPSAAEKPKDNGCITIVETDDPPTEEIIIPPKPSADLVAQKVAEYINQFRTEQGDVTATVIPGLTEYCKYTKRLYGKTDGRLFYHFVQSFSVDENISPQTAHEIAVRFAEETEKFQGFEIVVSTHCDRDHIHSHFVINSVNAESGKKFHISESEVEMLMRKSDAICLEYGLSVLKPKPPTERAKPMNDREYRSAEKGESWKIRLEAVISTAMQTAGSKEHFIMLMEAEGYGVKWTDTRKNITYTTPEGKACRDSKLHLTKFLKESMEYEFLYRAEITARINNQSTTTNHHRRKGSSLRGGDRAELDGNDIYAESADRIVEGDSKHPTYADNSGRTEKVYGSATIGVDALHRADQGSDRTVSGGNGNIGGGTDGEDPSFDSGYRETGWENERELFEQHLYASQYGGGQAGEAHQQTVFYISDTFSSAHSVGTDAAYLIGDIGNIIDEDAPVEDCTTMNQPRRQKKNTGPVMGGM